MIMPELLEIYRRAMPHGIHTREQIKAWGEEMYNIDSFSPHRLQELLNDPIDGIDAFCKHAAHTVPACNLVMKPFPECADVCAAIEFFGCSECESICPKKFDKHGNPRVLLGHGE